MKRKIVILVLIVITCSINKTCKYESLQSIKSNQSQQQIIASSCPQNSQCMQNGYCACKEHFIGDCKQRAITLQEDKQQIANLTNKQFTLFRITTNSTIHVMLIFTLCHNKTSDNTFQLIKVWSQDGNIEYFNQSTAMQGDKKWQVKQGCIRVYTPYLMFSDQMNGKRQQYILGIKISSEKQLPISVLLQIQGYDFLGMMNQIMLIMSGCLLMSISIAIAYVTYKWKSRRQYKARVPEKNDISYFQTMMPKMKLSNKETLVFQDLCSICLLDLKQDEWIRKTICGHIFHQQCLDSWCLTHLNCPVCRGSFKIQQIHNEGSNIENKIYN